MGAKILMYTDIHEFLKIGVRKVMCVKYYNQCSVNLIQSRVKTHSLRAEQAKAQQSEGEVYRDVLDPRAVGLL